MVLNFLAQSGLDIGDRPAQRLGRQGARDF
jgi:hypothetical protein